MRLKVAELRALVFLGVVMVCCLSCFCLLWVFGVRLLFPPFALHPPGGSRLEVCGSVRCGACPPHFDLVDLAAGCLTPMDGHHSHL